jgi:hypothetical protein
VFVVVSCVCRGLSGRKLLSFDYLHRMGRNFLFIYMLNVKIHWVAQGTRPVACVLGSEGLAPIIHG